MIHNYTERRREPQDEHYNDSPDARFTRSLDQRPPHIRSSQAITEPMSESSSPIALLGERIATILGAVILIIVLVGLATGGIT